MFTRAERIRTGEVGPYAPGGTFDRLARVGRGLAAPFLPRARGISAEETDPLRRAPGGRRKAPVRPWTPE
jgi:hypothetical protein